MWLFFGIFLTIAFSIDLGLFKKLKNFLIKEKNKGHLTSNNNTQIKNSHDVIINQSDEQKNALRWTIVWVSLAALFAFIIYIEMGYAKSLEFITAYTVEKSLSVDNMFLFLLIFSSLSIPIHYQHRVLSIGILSAILFRILLILAGISLLETFHWMIYVFAGLLFITAVRLIVQRKEKKIELEKNIAIRILKRIIPIDLKVKSTKFLIKRDGIIYATPLLVALVIVEMTDIVFAIDSIPAVLAITNDFFIVVTSNIFAILGLRSLYLLLAGSMEKFYYLKPALILLLLFIGIKMLLSEAYKIPVEISLLVIGTILASAILLSILKTTQMRRNKNDLNTNNNSI